MSDLSQTQLREPDQMDWDNYNPGSKYSAPPAALGPDGKFLLYSGQIKPAFVEKDFSATEEGYRSYMVGPITLVKNGQGIDGHTIKFAYVNVKKRVRNGKPIDASSAGDYLRSSGITAKPQTNAQYDAAVKQTANRVVKFAIDWEAKNKETGEEVKGYLAFPVDPTRPGQRKAILRGAHTDEKGNLIPADEINILDEKGQPTGQTVPVKSEVLFANARIRFFSDPNRK